jgi:hypothetical protein
MLRILAIVNLRLRVSALILQHPPQQLHILRKRRIGGA